MEHHPNYYAVIPAAVRYDGRVCANAKLLYGEITALASKEGYCWAGNAHFAKLYGVSLRNASRWVSELAKAGHIVIEGTGGERKIRIVGVQANFFEQVNEEPVKVEKKVPETKTAGHVINEIMDMFREVNPSVNRLFKRNDQRKAIDELVAQHGREKIEAIIKFLPKSNGHRYAPKITTPVELAEKFGKLIAWAEAEKQGKGSSNKGKKILI